MIQAYEEKRPTFESPCRVHDMATVIGDVRLSAYVSIFPGAVLRGDENHIAIGEYSNVQDGCLLHVSHERPVLIGHHVTIGHGAILHACTVEDGALIGMGAIVLDGAVVGKGAVIAAGALVSPGTQVEPGMVYMGTPAKARRPVTPEEATESTAAPEAYWQRAQVLMQGEPALKG